MLVTLMLHTGLAGCGPASSDNAANLGLNASVGGAALSQQGSSPRTDLFIPAASPVPLASGNETSLAPGKGTGPEGNSSLPVSASSTKPADTLDPSVVPALMVKELDSPDARVRLRALETWVKSAPQGAVDLLLLAYEDKDERVRARAMELIEQAWAREAEAEK